MWPLTNSARNSEFLWQTLLLSVLSVRSSVYSTVSVRLSICVVCWKVRSLIEFSLVLWVNNIRIIFPPGTTIQPKLFDQWIHRDEFINNAFCVKVKWSAILISKEMQGFRVLLVVKKYLHIFAIYRIGLFYTVAANGQTHPKWPIYCHIICWFNCRINWWLGFALIQLLHLKLNEWPSNGLVVICTIWIINLGTLI